MSQSKSIRVALVGAGIAGLSCAYELQEAGFQVTVFEKESQVGGRMATRVKDGFHFDIGADHLCNVYEVMIQQAKDFDLGWESMRFLGNYVRRDGKMIPLSKSGGLWGTFRLGLRYALLKPQETFLDLTPFAKHDWDNAYSAMRRFCGKTVADYVVDSFCSTYQFHHATEMSMAVVRPIMRSFKDRLPDWDLHQLVGGMSALPEAYAERLMDVRLNTPVRKIKALDEGLEVTSKDKEKFDVVVINCPTPIAVKLYENPTPEQRNMMEEATYAASISVAFKVPVAKLPKKSICWVSYQESKKISGFVNESMKGESCIVDGETLISAWLHEEFALEIMDKSDEEIYKLVAKELARVCEWVELKDIKSHDLQRWPYAMPKFRVGHIRRVANFLENGQGDNNVYYSADFLNSPWTEGALRCGKRVAKEIVKKHLVKK